MTIVTFFGLYLAGLATFASPCVLPLLPLYVSILAGPRAPTRLRLALAGLGFALGLSIVFVVLGMGVSSLALALSNHRRALLLAAGVLMIAFGASLTGLFRVGLLDRDVRPLLEKVPSPGGFFGCLLFGAAFALGWTPCVGPILGAALSYAASHAAAPRLAAAQLAVYAAGLSTPLVAAAIAAPRILSAAKRLRGATPVIQRAMGVVLIGMGLLVATDRVSALAPLASATSGVATSAPAASVNACATPGATACSFAEHGEQADGTAAVPVGRPHLVELVSGHCTVCAKMAPVVAELERECTRGDGSVVRIDVETPMGSALAARFGVHAVPTFLQLDSLGAEVERRVGEQSRSDLALALENVRGEACSLL